MRKWFNTFGWEIFPVIIALVILAVAMFINPSRFQNMAWYGLVALTALYAWGTIRIARENKRTVEEMRQSRLDAVKPALSLQPGLFTFGGGFSEVYLVNSGGVAKDVKIDIEVTKPELKRLLFVPAIDREHKVHLGVDDKARDQGGVVKVGVIFKDGYNQMLNESFSIDFSELKEEGREILSQYSELFEVKRILEGIERQIGHTRQKVGA
jgi:hypothetical protein